MKLLVILVSMVVSSAAVAAQDKCVVNYVNGNTTTTTQYDMQVRQSPYADIPSYVLDVNHEGFQVFVIEADGNFWGHIKTATGTVEAPAQENGVSLAATEGDKAVYVECF
jgi:hypothetical protein